MAMVKNNLLGLEFPKIPMLKPFLAFVLGIYIGYYHRMDSFMHWYLVVFSFFVLQCLGFFKRKQTWGRLLFVLAFYSTWCLLGMWLTLRTMPSYQPSHFSNFVGKSLLVVVDDEPQLRGKMLRFPAVVKAVVSDTGKTRTIGKLMMTIGIDSVAMPKIQYGDMLHVINNVKEVKMPSNPNEFNYRNYLATKNIWHQCFLASDEVIKIDVGKANIILANALSFREQMMEKFSLYIEDGRALQLAVALIFGYRSEMDEQMVKAFTNTGTVHILSVSGLHVAMVFGILTLLLKWMGYFPYGRPLRSVLVVSAVWFYVVLTGMSPPILRAGIMITFFIVSFTVSRQQVTLNTLFASALFILLLFPKSLFDIGFQLSYLAVLGILLLQPLLKKLYLPTIRWWSWIVEYTYISIAAQLFTLPVILYYFGQFPTYFIPANLFIALPSTGIMYLGILLALCPLELINTYVGVVLEALLQFSVYGLAYLERLPYAVLDGIIWSQIQVVLAFLILIAMVCAWNYRYKKALFMAMACLLIFSVFGSFQYVQRSTYSGYRIYDVRSHLAIAQIKKGKAVLYTTFDSLSHSGSRFSILPDLCRFVPLEHIEYKKLVTAGRQNHILSLGDKRILILETGLRDTLSDVDMVIWRKNNKNTIASVVEKLGRTPLFLFDGSNADRTIASIYSDSLDVPMYILKNNFAYVWDGE